MNGFLRKGVVCHTVEKEEAGTQQKSGTLKGEHSSQQIATQKGSMSLEIHEALSLLVQCQLATKELIDKSDTFVADVMEEFLASIDKHRVAMHHLLEVYK